MPFRPFLALLVLWSGVVWAGVLVAAPAGAGTTGPRQAAGPGVEGPAADLAVTPAEHDFLRSAVGAPPIGRDPAARLLVGLETRWWIGGDHRARVEYLRPNGLVAGAYLALTDVEWTFEVLRVPHRPPGSASAPSTVWTPPWAASTKVAAQATWRGKVVERDTGVVLPVAFVSTSTIDVTAFDAQALLE